MPTIEGMNEPVRRMKCEVVNGQRPVASEAPRSSFSLLPSSFSLLIALLALVAGGKAVLYDTIDPDCFWHLRVAAQLQRDGIGPIVDDISFASIKTAWTPYSWLAELGMKAIWDLGGFRLAVLVQALLMAGFVILVAQGARELTRERNPLAIISATVIAMFLSLPYLSFRPVTFVIDILAACFWLVLRDRRLGERSRAVWCIIPLTIVMTNCHFFAILVPIGMAALLLGAIWNRERAGRHAILLALTLLACCMTPMLPGALRAVWNYQFADPMVGGGVIAEFQPIWKSPIGMAIALLWIGLCIRHRDRFSAGESLLILGSFVLLMRLGRFAPVVAPILAATLAVAMPPLGDRVIRRLPIRIAVAGVLAIGLLRIAAAFPSHDTQLSYWLNRHGPGTPGYPTAAADYVSKRIPPGRVINEFTWGGYLAWSLGDQFQVLMDGRTQLYTPEFWQASCLGDSETAKPILSSAHALAAILPVQRSRFREPLIGLGWIPIYHDDRAEVLIPPMGSASITP